MNEACLVQQKYDKDKKKSKRVAILSLVFVLEQNPALDFDAAAAAAVIA